MEEKELTFEEALSELKAGRIVNRKSWSEKKHRLKMKQCVFLVDNDGNESPWFPQTSDLIASDWETDRV